MIIVRTDGTTETRDIPAGSTSKDILEIIRAAIGAEVLDSFSLNDGNRVWVDDLGYRKQLPENAQATILYHGICRPGTTHVILGDVAIVEDEL